MVLLESYDRFDDLVELEPTTGNLRWFSERDSLSLATVPIHGAISLLDGHWVFLYRQSDTLHFRVDHVDIELTSDTRIELVRGATNILTILRGDAAIFRLEYVPYTADKIDEWRTYLNPFIEDEHFDFGLFVYNVMSNSAHRGRLYR